MSLASRTPAEGVMFPIDFDFELGTRVDELRQAVREFAVRRIAPQADEIDRSNRFRVSSGPSSEPWACSA